MIPVKQTGDPLIAEEVNEIVSRLSYDHIFDNVEDMKSFIGYTEGDRVKWLGYYTPGDLGGGQGVFTESLTLVDDGGSIFGTVQGGNILAEITNRTVSFYTYGAKDMGSNEITEDLFDSSDAIQRAIRSPYHVRAGAGYFYIASSVYIDSSKHVEMQGVGSVDYNTVVEGEGECTHIFTDQDIDVFIVGTLNQPIKITGGFIDCSKIPFHTKSAFLIDVAKGTHKIQIDVAVGGNSGSLIQEGCGTTGVKYDLIGSTWDHANSSFDNIKLRAISCARAFMITDKFDSQWIPFIDVDIIAMYCKQAAFFGAANDSKCYIQAQCGAWLPPEEKDWAVVYVAQGTRLELECQFSDLHPGESRESGTKWHAKTGVENHSKECQLRGNRTYGQIRFGNIEEGDYPFANRYGHYYDVDRFTLSSKLKGGWGRSRGFIADMHNSLIGVDNRVGVTITAYKGDGFDFNTQLEPGSTYSLEVDSGVAIERPERLLDKSSRLATIIRFNDQRTDENTDFVEIVIPEAKKYDWFELYTQDTRLNTPYVQVIKTVPGNPQASYILSTNDRYGNGGYDSWFHQFPTTDSGGLIIRFIGSYKRSGSTAPSVVIHDICAYASDADLGVITTSGGQRVYGDLRFGTVSDKVSGYSLMDLVSRIEALENQ